MKIKRNVKINDWDWTETEIPVCSECCGWLGRVISVLDGHGSHGEFEEYVDDWKFCPYCSSPL